MSTIRVLVADGQPLLREGVAALLAAQGDMLLVAEAADAGQAQLAFRACSPDVTLVDLQLPGGGLHAIAELHREAPGARIVALTVQRNDPQALRALETGACAWLCKGQLRGELVDAVRAAHAKAPPPAAPHAFAEPLSHRELDVLRAVAGGNSNKRIAGQLGISEETVKAHMRNILSKLGAHDRTHAVTIALRRGELEV